MSASTRHPVLGEIDRYLVERARLLLGLRSPEAEPEPFDAVEASDVRMNSGPSRVEVDWVFHGRHARSVAGEEPTCRDVVARVSVGFVVERGQITAEQPNYDEAAVLRQLGVDHVHDD